MKYQIQRQERKNWCVVASLQAVLCRRGIRVSQKEISELLPFNSEGVVLNNSVLNNFLARYTLRAEYVHPRKTIVEIDQVLEERRDSDGLALFSPQELTHSSSTAKHCCLVRNFHYPFLELDDPEKRIERIDFGELTSAMPLDEQCGFYFID